MILSKEFEPWRHASNITHCKHDASLHLHPFAKNKEKKIHATFWYIPRFRDRLQECGSQRIDGRLSFKPLMTAITSS